MSPRPKSRLAPALIVVAGVLCAVLAVYVGGYFAASDRQDGSTSDIRFRTFGAKWQCALYSPAAWMEAATTRTTVFLCYSKEGLYEGYLPWPPDAE